MTKKAKKVNYVQLEPAAFLSDDDFQMMSDAERGIYITIILYLYSNNGRIKNDPKVIKRLCNVTSHFEQKWESVMSKLYPKGVWLRHRRVDVELKKAKEKMQIAVESGFKGAKKRWGGHKGGQSIPVANENETKSKRSKGNTSNSKRELTSVEKSFSDSNSFRFVDALETIIKPRNQGDRTANRNLSVWIKGNILVNKFNDDIYKRIIDYATEAKQNGRNPAAMFYSILQRELGYRKQATGG